MKSISTVASLLTLVASAFACDGHDHSHELAKRLDPSAPLTPPSRPLVWGDVNVISTTDSHGWLLGHQKSSFPEPNYSGDFGDFASFVHRMKAIAKDKDVDLLLVDSGDLHDGTGLSDGYPAGGVDGHESNKFFTQLPYDILAIGNHELYDYPVTFDMYQNFAPKYPGRYLSSNVNITVLDKRGNNVSVPVGSRYAKFKTTKGRKVTAFGVLYDFTGNAKNTTVQKVASMVQESWFAEAIKDAPDFFLLVGHMPVSEDNWPLVVNAIRAVHPTTPIMVFGGHTHIRDCVQYDGRSMAIESGRYMETLGWMSMKLDKKTVQSSTNITFSRRYLDPNRVTYAYHTGTTHNHFDTSLGQKITQGLLALAKTFSLSTLYGTAPRDFTLSQSPYPSNDSLLTLFIGNATPTALAINNTRASIPNIIITNSGSQRFDVYAGAFTKNDELTASPFADAFLYIPAVPLSVATKLLPLLNGEGEQRRALAARDADAYARGWVGERYNAWLARMDERAGGAARRAAKNQTLGYVTADGCPGIGDDTPHAPLPYFAAPAFIQSAVPALADAAPIDLVFVDFIEAQLIKLLNGVQTAKNYTVADVQTYSPFLANQVLGLYAKAAWN